MSYVWVVTREGIYRHEIMGIFKSKSEAFDCAKISLKKEGDDYHKFWVLKIPFGEELPLDTPSRLGSFHDWDHNNASMLKAIFYRTGPNHHIEIPEDKK